MQSIRATAATPDMATPQITRSLGRPTQAQVELRNRELLDRALDHFLEKGFEGATVEAITASVGMAKRTIYARYGDKESLFKAALQQAIDEWIVPIDQLEAAEGDDIEASLIAIARILVANLLNPAGLRLLRITNRESYRMPEFGAYAYNEGTRPTVGFLAGLFQRRLPVAAPDLPDVETIAMAFLDLVMGQAKAVAWGLDVDQATNDRHTSLGVRLFLRGLLPR